MTEAPPDRERSGAEEERRTHRALWRWAGLSMVGLVDPTIIRIFRRAHRDARAPAGPRGGDQPERDSGGSSG